MNYTKYIKSGLLLTALVFVGTVMSSCKDDIVLTNTVDEGNYDKVNGVYGYIKNNQDARANVVVELRAKDLQTEFSFGLTKASDKAVDVTLRVDAALAEQYNKSHKTSFEVYPVGLISIEDDGAVLIAPGEMKSDPVAVTIKPSSELVVGTTYLVPIAARSVTSGVKLDNVNYMLLVKNLGFMPDCNKTPDIKIISCMEVNDANPLNNLEFTLKNSGKPLIDMVVLFSSNINYNTETGRVYLNHNENVTVLLENREKYLKPLQDRGMKVILSILGNHDIAGVASLSDPVAVQFAAEMKACCDAYKLDGVFFDDEYSDGYASGPGFVSPSRAAASRLIFETKKAMPDKLIMPYIWSTTSSLIAVDGVQPGDYIDFAIADYGRSASTGFYPGSVQKQMVPWSQEYNQSRFQYESTVKRVRTEGYGGHMIFAMNPCRRKEEDNWSAQLNSLKIIATQIFEDELVWTGNVYPKNEPNSASREEWVANKQPE